MLDDMMKLRPNGDEILRERSEDIPADERSDGSKSLIVEED